MPDHIRDTLTRIGNTIRRAARDLLQRLADLVDPDPKQSGAGVNVTINHSGPGYPPDLQAIRDHHRRTRRTRRAGSAGIPDDFYRNR